MSTIAANVSTKAKIGAAALALAGAATFAPAVAVATPPSFSVAQAVGSSVSDLSVLPVLPGGLNATVNSTGGNVVSIVDGVIVGLASIPLYTVVAVRDTFYTIGNAIGGPIGGVFLGFGHGLNDALQNGPFRPYGV
ncbi:MAG: hypothetical protein WBB07_00915 [Mycobacterium sp.]